MEWQNVAPQQRLLPQQVYVAEDLSNGDAHQQELGRLNEKAYARKVHADLPWLEVSDRGRLSALVRADPVSLRQCR